MAKGQHYFFGRNPQLEFYAERGMITLIDMDRAASDDYTADETIKRLSPGDFLKRAVAVRMSTPDNYDDRHSAASKLLEEAKIVVKEAIAQGDPTDPKVQEHHAKHGGGSRKPTQIAMPKKFQDTYKIKRDSSDRVLWNGPVVERASSIIMPGE